jgi:uncharacterized membrane protein YbaN (DUF454 family)
MRNRVTGRSSFAENSLSTKIYQRMLPLRVFHKMMALNKKKKIKFCSYMTALYFTSVMMCEMP